MYKNHQSSIYVVKSISTLCLDTFISSLIILKISSLISSVLLGENLDPESNPSKVTSMVSSVVYTSGMTLNIEMGQSG